MDIRWNNSAETYEIETETLFMSIDPHSYYSGVCGVIHRADMVNLVRPRTAFLNAEYYMRPGQGAPNMIPRQLSKRRECAHEREAATVHLRYPLEPEFQMGMTLAYTARPDGVDMLMTIDPQIAIPSFEIFFASYVCEALKETWWPLLAEDGSGDWQCPDNRQQRNGVFAAVLEPRRRAIMADGRWPIDWNIEEQCFAKPIIVARNPRNGITLVFLCDPHATTLVGGQHHIWDTAHDWAFGRDLQPGKTFSARARMICQQWPDVDDMFANIETFWQEFAH